MKNLFERVVDSIVEQGESEFTVSRGTSARGYWTQTIAASSPEEALQKANEDPYLNATEIEYESEDDDITDAEEDDVSA